MVSLIMSIHEPLLTESPAKSTLRISEMFVLKKQISCEFALSSQQLQHPANKGQSYTSDSAYFILRML